MRTYTETITLTSQKPREFLDLTPKVKAAVQKSGIQDGLVLVASLHVNAGIVVNDGEPGLLADLDAWLDKLAPHRDDYQHARGESNASAHLKTILAGQSAALPLVGGKLEFGPWQQVLFAEFDGQRPKRVLIQVLGE
jgi:secondary thiamine-phosphate synthase enzyme